MTEQEPVWNPSIEPCGDPTHVDCGPTHLDGGPAGEPVRPCPDKAALNIKGEHFPCDAMHMMAPESDTHQGWPHSNRAAGAIWNG